MSKEEEVRSAMVQAMKAGDKERKESLSMLLQSLKKKRIDERRDLTEEEENSIVLKEVKQMKESIDLTPKDRTDLIEQYTSRMNVFEEFAPKMMSEEEIQAVIKDVLNGLGIEKPAPSDKGKIMKELMPKVKGKADGKEVNRILGAMFS
ncbi:MAG: GatB/YqeY domain-containing protein [Clostridiales bacterium]|nr:GatB/YqeY domain-containing protein [Clostridiales bacterium]